MIKVNKATYDLMLSTQPTLVKRTRNGFYLLGKNKWIDKKETNKKEDKKWKQKE